MNKSKRKGTAAETAVTRYLQAHGFPNAERRTLHGAQDLGDIKLCPHRVIEVKAGKTAQEASWAQIRKWWAETERERANAGANAGYLVVQRRGVGLSQVHKWTTYQHYAGQVLMSMDLGDLVATIGECCE